METLSKFDIDLHKIYSNKDLNTFVSVFADNCDLEFANRKQFRYEYWNLISYPVWNICLVLQDSVLFKRFFEQLSQSLKNPEIMSDSLNFKKLPLETLGGPSVSKAVSEFLSQTDGNINSDNLLEHLTRIRTILKNVTIKISPYHFIDFIEYCDNVNTLFYIDISRRSEESFRSVLNYLPKISGEYLIRSEKEIKGYHKLSTGIFKHSCFYTDFWYSSDPTFC